VVGFVAAKIVLLFDTAKLFEGEFYYEGKKGCKRSEISSWSCRFRQIFIVSDLDLWKKGRDFAV